MNIEQTATLLAEIQLIDNRRVDEEVLVSWHELIGDLDAAQAREAVMLHRRESPAWLTPAHVRANVERMQVAALGPREDDFGNVIEPEPAALAAARRASGVRKAVES